MTRTSNTEGLSLVKDGGAGNFDPSRDNLHDIRELLESLSPGGITPGTVYFVDATNGVDTNTGLSADDAFKTIGKFVGGTGAVAVDNDVAICWGAFNESVVVNKRVRLTGLGMGWTTLTQSGALTIITVEFRAGSSGSEISGFRLDAASVVNTVISINNDPLARIKIHHNEFVASYSIGIQFSSSNVTFCIIEDNYFTGLPADGIDLGAGGAIPTDNIVRRNVFTMSAGGIPITIGGARNTVVQNHIMTQNTQCVEMVNAANTNNHIAGNYLSRTDGGSVMTIGVGITGNAIQGNTCTAQESAAGFTVTAAQGTAETNTLSPIDVPTNGRIAVTLDMNSLVAAAEGGTTVWRLYYMIDGTNYRLLDRKTFVVGTDTEHVVLTGYAGNGGVGALRVSNQMGTAVTGNRAIPYRIVWGG